MKKILGRDYLNEEIDEYMIVKRINYSPSLTLYVVLTDLKGNAYAVSINDFDRMKICPISDMLNFEIVKDNDGKPLHLNEELAIKIEDDFRIKMKSGMYDKLVVSNIADVLPRAFRKVESPGLTEDKFFELVAKSLDERELRYLSEQLPKGLVNCDDGKCENVDITNSCKKCTNYKVIGQYKCQNRNYR